LIGLLIPLGYAFAKLVNAIESQLNGSYYKSRMEKKAKKDKEHEQDELLKQIEQEKKRKAEIELSILEQSRELDGLSHDLMVKKYKLTSMGTIIQPPSICPKCGSTNFDTDSAIGTKYCRNCGERFY